MTVGARIAGIRKHRSAAIAIGAIFLALAYGGAHAGQEPAEVVGLHVTGPSVEIFDSERDGCASDDIPDLPLRAVRLADGSVSAIASQWHNRLFRGRALDDLKRDCRIVYKGNEDDAPEKFDDRSWISALWTENGRDIYALIHNEYQAHRHPPRCPIGKYFPCWYNTVVFGESHDGGESFKRSEGAAALVAAPAFGQDVGQGKPRGFMTPSNIVKRDGYWYSFVFTPGYGDQRHGSCLIRTATITDPASWRAWDGKGFTVQLGDPYKAAASELRQPCLRILPFPRAVDSVVRVGSTETWIAVYTSAVATGKITEPGVYYSVSHDLTTWSTPTLLLALPMQLAGKCATEPTYMYASLLDPDATTPSFEDAKGDAFLYMTRSEVSKCNSSMHRALVRWPVRIEEHTEHQTAP